MIIISLFVLKWLAYHARGGRGQEQEEEVDLKLPLGLERGLSILLWGGGLGASSSPDIALFNRIS